MKMRYTIILVAAASIALVTSSNAQNVEIDSSAQNPKFSGDPSEVSASSNKLAKKKKSGQSAQTRKAGELEGWAGDESSSAGKASASKSKKEKYAPQQNSAGRNEDGGLPLPNQTGPATAPNVGYDGSRLSTGIKF